MTDRISIIQAIQASYSDVLPEALTEGEITLNHSKTVETKQLIDDSHWYPFDGQKRTCYEIERNIDPRFGSPQTVTEVIETRPESELTFIISTSNSINIDEFQTRLNLRGTNYTLADLSLAPTHETICELARTADNILKASTPTDTSSSEATTQIQNGETIPLDWLRATTETNIGRGETKVTYTDSQFDIVTDKPSKPLFGYLTKKKTQREYITQLIESTFHRITQ